MAVCLGAIPPTVRAAEGWWDGDWRFRYALDVSPAGGGDVAHVRFNIPPGARPDGRDARVIDANGRTISREVMFYEPALYGVVAFDCSAGGRNYWLYLGNPTAPAPSRDWTAEAGVFLTTRQMAGSLAPRNLKEMLNTLKSSQRSFGATFRPNIYDGFNPLGEPDNYVSIYRGWLRVRSAGKYLFATISDDASFLLIDGKEIVSWPGLHTAQGGVRAQRNKRVDLKAGLHRIDYYHCDVGEEQAAMAVWAPPGARQPSVIGKSYFVPVRMAIPGSLEILNQTLAPDFNAVQEDWIKIGDQTYTLYKFTDASTLTSGRIVGRSWEFSDGSKARGAEVEKMFCRADDYQVKLTVNDDRNRASTVERPFRVHAVDNLEAGNDQFGRQTFAGVALSMKLDELDAPDAAAAAELLIDQQFHDEAAALYESILSRGDLDAGDLKLSEAYLGLLLGPMEQPERGIKLTRRALSRVSKNVPLAVGLLLRIGRIEMDELARPQDALVDFKAAQLRLDGAKSDDAMLRRNVLIALGDGHRAQGHADEAYEAYAAAEAIVLPNVDVKPFDVSSYALTVESHLLRRQYDEARKILDQWENEHPTERLTGYSSLLRSRLEFRQGNLKKAIGEIEAYLSCDPVGLFAKQALLHLGDLCLRAEKGARAKEVFQQVLDQFQDEEATKAARRGLQRAAKLMEGKNPPAAK
jgi:tetratricopeptide (TPR) repeat protein